MTEIVRGLLCSLLVASCSFPKPPDVGPGGGDDDDAPPEGPAYQLLAVRPAMAAAGDKLTLEGTFGDTVTVRFPGGLTQTATLLGEHRATVIVPEGATAGDLTVTSADTTLGPVSFRRVPFSLGLQPFRISYEQTDGARQSPQLRIARSGATATVTSRWVYVVGGDSGTGPVNSIERGATNADGALDTLDLVADVSLLEARSGHSAAMIGTSLFVVGGTGTSGALRSVERAEIAANGTIDRFAAESGAVLGTARWAHTSLLIGGFLYVIGGAASDGTKLGSIERAPIRRDGSLGAFAPVDVTLTVPRSGHTAEVIGNTLYVIGGSATGDAPVTSIERAAITADGSIGPFAAASGTALAAARTGHQSIVLGGAVYALGGSTSGGITASIERAPINFDGTIGPFSPSTVTALRLPRVGATTAIISNHLHLIGGRNTGGAIAKVERASLSASGAVGAFSQADLATVEPRGFFTTTVIRDTAFIIGSGGGNTVEIASIPADGSLSSPATLAGIALTTPRSEHCVAVIRNSLYVIGGVTSDFTGSVERAVIDANGALGPFNLMSVALQEPRMGHACVVVGNFLYVLGGVNQTHHPTTFERAAINDDGSLSTFTTVTDSSLVFGRHFFSAITTDSYIYLVAGLTDDIVDNTKSIERAAIASDGSLGQFTLVSPLFARRAIYTSTIVGATLYLVGGFVAGEFTNSVARADINIDGSLTTFVTSSLSVSRARHTAIATSNAVYLLGGITEGPGGSVDSALKFAHAELH